MKQRITITLEEEIINAVDRKIDGRKIKNRSHAIELFLSRALGENYPKKAVFLLGGKGTRLRPITYELPKALLPVQGKTVPEHLFDLFKKYNIRNFIFSVGYKSKKIEDYFGDGSKFGVNISYVEEKTRLGSAGALKLASPSLNEPFIVTNGDELKEIDLEDMYYFHKENDALITVALTTVDNPSSYGVARLQGNKILEFVEKPDKDKAPSKLIHAGLSIWQPEALKFIPKGFSMFEKNVFPKVAEEEKLFGYNFSGQWYDTGTPERYERALKEWKGIKKD
ncbi:NTP transferase domain-containing protein [Candidatus Woesearchaeota archaeon]|nr:NTP transferase domain-containing protein [Candidatus Woesearchaeota archaeon]